MSLVWKQWADTELFPTLSPFSSIKSKELYKNCLLCEFKIINFLQYTYKIFHDSVKCSNHFFLLFSLLVFYVTSKKMSAAWKCIELKTSNAMYRGGFCFLASIIFLALIRLICLQITNVSLTISVNVPS